VNNSQLVTLVSCGFLLWLLSCANGSIQSTVVADRLQDYQRTSKEYHSHEEDYLALLSNIEQEPTDTFLMDQKKIQMKELTDLRAVMLQSRSELDEAVQKWEIEIRELQFGGAKISAPDPKKFKNATPADTLLAKSKAAPVNMPAPRGGVLTVTTTKPMSSSSITVSSSSSSLIILSSSFFTSSNSSAATGVSSSTK